MCDAAVVAVYLQPSYIAIHSFSSQPRNRGDSAKGKRESERGGIASNLVKLQRLFHAVEMQLDIFVTFVQERYEKKRERGGV